MLVDHDPVADTTTHRDGYLVTDLQSRHAIADAPNHSAALYTHFASQRRALVGHGGEKAQGNHHVAEVSTQLQRPRSPLRPGPGGGTSQVVICSPLTWPGLSRRSR